MEEDTHSLTVGSKPVRLSRPCFPPSRMREESMLPSSQATRWAHRTLKRRSFRCRHRHSRRPSRARRVSTWSVGSEADSAHAAQGSDRQSTRVSCPSGPHTRSRQYPKSGRTSFQPRRSDSDPDQTSPTSSSSPLRAEEKAKLSLRTRGDGAPSSQPDHSSWRNRTAARLGLNKARHQVQ